MAAIDSTVCGPLLTAPCAAAGLIARLCNTLVVAASMAAVSESLAVGKRLGVDSKVLTQVREPAWGGGKALLWLCVWGWWASCLKILHGRAGQLRLPRAFVSTVAALRRCGCRCAATQAHASQTDGVPLMTS